MDIKTYEVFDHKGFLLNSDKKGELFKYDAIYTHLGTGIEKVIPREAMFLNHSCFRSCLDRWNREGKAHANVHQWSYRTRKL